MTTATRRIVPYPARPVARDWDDLFITGRPAPASGEPEPEREERRRGFFRRMRENLRKTREALSAEVQATLFSGDLDEETWERLEEALIYADVGARTTAQVVAQLEQEAEGCDPGAVAFDAVARGRERGADVVIVDTAGRLHTQRELMAELEKVRRVITKQMPDAPHETLMTVDATTGQNGVRQAQLFGEAVGVTGIVLTKLDGTAKGGIALAIANELGIPVKLIGIGEQLDDAVVRGEVALDTPLADCLPGARPRAPITLGELATHTAGLPRLPLAFL